MNNELVWTKLGGKIDFSTKSVDLNDQNAEYFIQVQKHFANGLIAL